MNPLAALSLLFFQYLDNTPPTRIPVRHPAAWRRRIGARRARGWQQPAAPWLVGPSRCEKECRSVAGKTLRHRITGQVRSLVFAEHGVEFAQDGPRPRFIRRSFVAAAKWLRNAEVVA